MVEASRVESMAVPAFVITIEGLVHSEVAAARCIQSAAELGIVVKAFQAITRYEAIPLMLERGLDINRRIYREISDRPIGDRALIPQGEWWMTSPEIGCCLSHFSLWEKCMAMHQAIMILEHDVVFLDRPPELPVGALALNLAPTHYSGTQGYVITPRAARKAVMEVRNRGIQPSDEVLWRTALKSSKVVECEPPVIKHEHGGVSTIQFTRTDDHHKEIGTDDPWQKYSQRDLD